MNGLYNSFIKKVVILIDEYDRQLTANIYKPALYDEFKELLRSIYAVSKIILQLNSLQLLVLQD